MATSTRTHQRSISLAELAEAQSRWLPLECKGALWLAQSAGLTGVPLDVVFQASGAPAIQIPTLGDGLEPGLLPEPTQSCVLVPGGVLEFGGPVERIFLRPHMLQRGPFFGQPIEAWSPHANDNPPPEKIFSAHAAFMAEGFVNLTFGDCQPPQAVNQAPLSGIIAPTLYDQLAGRLASGLVLIGNAASTSVAEVRTPTSWNLAAPWQRMSRIMARFVVLPAQSPDADPRGLWAQVYDHMGAIYSTVLSGVRQGAVSPLCRYALNLGSPQEAMAQGLFAGSGGVAALLNKLGASMAAVGAGHQVYGWLVGDHGRPRRGHWEEARVWRDVNPNVPGSVPIMNTATVNPTVAAVAVPLNANGVAHFTALVETFGPAGFVDVQLVSAEQYTAMVADGAALTAPAYGALAQATFAPGAAQRGTITLSTPALGSTGVVAIILADRGGGVPETHVRSYSLRAA